MTVFISITFFGLKLTCPFPARYSNFFLQAGTPAGVIPCLITFVNIQANEPMPKVKFEPRSFQVLQMKVAEIRMCIILTFSNLSYVKFSICKATVIMQ